MKHDLARQLRREQTDLERKLWYALRNRRFAGFKFRRQQPIGPYVADFICFEAKPSSSWMASNMDCLRTSHTTTLARLI